MHFDYIYSYKWVDSYPNFVHWIYHTQLIASVKTLYATFSYTERLRVGNLLLNIIYVGQVKLESSILKVKILDSGFKAVLQFYDIVRQGCCLQTCGLKMSFLWLANICTITTILNFPLTNLEVWCNYLKPALLGIKFEYLIYVSCKRLYATPYPSNLIHLSLRAIISIDFLQ